MFFGGLEIVALKWLGRKISAGMVTSLAYSSSVGVTHFAMHSVAATSASVQSASSLTAVTTALGSSAFAGAKSKELSLDENGRLIAQRGAGRSSGGCSDAAERAATQLAQVVEVMLDEQYASLEKAKKAQGKSYSDQPVSSV